MAPRVSAASKVRQQPITGECSDCASMDEFCPHRKEHVFRLRYVHTLCSNLNCDMAL